MKRRLNISELIKKGHAAAKARGVKLGNPEKLQECRAKTTQTNKAKADLFALKIMPIIEDLKTSEGLPSAEIAKALNTMGLRTRRKKVWTSAAVRSVVKRIRGDDSWYWWHVGQRGA